MPNLTRLNERTQRPNACINFIKPDASCSPADQEIATDFLNRIAAQCFPIMKENLLSVMTLEEFPPNKEFLGRNFDGGECIQLVLKDMHGRWLSFKFVQMVMMHELAHCKQMNHSKLFWGVRNGFAKDMEGLWARKYFGEGLWGRGKELGRGLFVNDRIMEAGDTPEHLCGGTYRRAGARKRKRGQESGAQAKETYAERQQKRIKRKFGVHGDGAALGEDELVRGGLEASKRGQGKPRVAQSKRGRELRANAALARFDAMKQKQQVPPLVEHDEDSGSETEWDEDDASSTANFYNEDGVKIKDGSGHDLVKVCGDEGSEDDGAQNEMDDMRMLGSSQRKGNSENAAELMKSSPQSKTTVIDLDDGSETESELDEDRSGGLNPCEGAEGADDLLDGDKDSVAPKKTHAPASSGVRNDSENDKEAVRSLVTTDTSSIADHASHASDIQPPRTEAWSLPALTSACPICTTDNGPTSPLCLVCSHVLKPSLLKDSWRCKNEPCKGSKYVNPGDFGRCGVCASLKPTKPADAGRPMGVVSADVLRWD